MTDFETLYQTDPDPWQSRTSWYERRKRDVLLSCLPRETYGNALELGCGIGLLTTRLARRCAHVCAIDLSPTAVAQCQAGLRQAGIGNVEAMVMQVPEQWPDHTPEHFDLIVVSEMAYYLPDPDVAACLAHCELGLATGGDWVMCHYLPDFHDRRQDTDWLHQHVADACRVDPMVRHVDAAFRLDIWRKHGRGPA